MTDKQYHTFKNGAIIAGRYEVIRCLGSGSMGLVYACYHRELDNHIVAVKVLYPEVSKDPVAVARFRNEIFASYGVSHPNVVRAYEYLKDRDLVAYSMEYVDGGDLATRLENEGKLPIDDILALLFQMARGVQAIHAAGIVHRDLKPENILLSSTGEVKIADFGIARTGQGQRLTEHGGVVGTIDYVSPEYLLNSQLDLRSDIYAIGVLAYEMVTGELPFKADSVYATMTKRLESIPEEPKKLRADCPKVLSDLILKALATDPDKRFQTAVELEDALVKIISKSLHLQNQLTNDLNFQDEPTVELQPANAERLRDLLAKEAGNATTVGIDEILISDQYVARKSAELSGQVILDSKRSTAVFKNPTVFGAQENSKSISDMDKDDQPQVVSLTKIIEPKKSKILSALYLLLCIAFSIIIGTYITKEFFPDYYEHFIYLLTKLNLDFLNTILEL